MDVRELVRVMVSQGYIKETVDNVVASEVKGSLRYLVLPPDAPKLELPPGAGVLVARAVESKHTGDLDAEVVRSLLLGVLDPPREHGITPGVGIVMFLEGHEREKALRAAALLVSNGYGGVPITVVYDGYTRWESAPAAEYTVEDSINESDCQHLSTLLGQSVDVDQFLKSLEAPR
jgi:hypothetical protein